MRRREFNTLLGGAAAGWPSLVNAQKAMPVIGWLSGASPDFYAPYFAAFRKGLDETGYVEGQNVTIEYRWAEGRYDRLPALAADLVGRKVDVIVASGGDLASHAAKAATRTIPIVFTGAGDPVADGRVVSLARPGGNLTGISWLAIDLNPKRIELLRELVPRARVIALLVNPSNATERAVRDLQEAARPAGVQLRIVEAISESEIDAVFPSLIGGQTDALLVWTTPFIDSRREQIVTLAARYSIPAIYGFRESASAGGLISYGVSLADVYKMLGIYVGKVLKGAKPADLPVLQPTTFELVINMKTAKALGLAVPPSLLARADEVIE